MDISLRLAGEGAVEDVQVDRAAKRDASSTPPSPSSAAVVKKVKRDVTLTSAGNDGEIDEDAAVELQIRIDEQWETERSNASNVTLEKATEEADEPGKAKELTASETPSLTPTMKDLTISMMALAASIESENRELGVQGHRKAREKGWTVTRELAYGLSRLKLNSGEMKLVVLNGREYIGREGEWWTEGLLMSTTLRPVAEPPIFDYEWMIEEKGWLEETAKSHDLKYDRDIKFKTERIDLLIEQRLLAEYKDWAEQDLQALHDHPTYRSVSESTKEERANYTRRLMASIALDEAEVDLNLWDLESAKNTSKRWDTLGIPTLEKPTEQVWRQQRLSILQSRSEELKLLEKPIHY